MKYNKEEIRLLRSLRKRKYKSLEDWEKFYIKDNVRLHRQRKKDLAHIDPFDPFILDKIHEGGTRKRGEKNNGE